MENNKKEIVKLLTGITLFILSFIFKSFFHYVLLFSSYLLLGYEVIFEAISNTLHGELLDENFLMTVATVAAIILGEYNEAVFVMLFYCVGEFAQDYASDKSIKNIENLVNLQPSVLHTIENGDINPKDAIKGCLFKVFPGEKISLDGEVIEGQTYLDTKLITGESVPKKIKKGDIVISGSIVLDSPLTIKAVKTYTDGTLGKILELVTENSKSKSNTEKFITKFAKYYTPAVLVLALLVAIIPPIFTGLWRVWIQRSLTFLVISCPCALVLSVPLAFFAGLGSCASKGILVKGAEHLENVASATAFAFDKTGTLTKGSFEVQEILPAKGIKEGKIIELAYALELNSKHPIAEAIKTYAQAKKTKVIKASDIKEKSGFGLSATVNKKTVFVGNEKLLKENKIHFDKCEKYGSIVYVANDANYLGCIVINDKIKENAKDCIKLLKELGNSKTFVLSGDNEKTVQFVSNKLGIDQYYANLLPQEKESIIKEIKSKHKCVYTGDGINDIPVMLSSDVAISMGTIGSDAAIEASDIVCTNDDLSKIPMLYKTAKKTVFIAKQNIAFTLVIKIICLILGALGITGLPMAIFADTGIALLAVLNSMRALS